MQKRFSHFATWECYPAGFDAPAPPGDMTPKEAASRYAAFLRDDDAFRAALDRVVTEWPNSCGRFLSDESINRIAWLGQASACIALGISSKFRGGFHSLTEQEQARANTTALEHLNKWLVSHGEAEVTT